MRLSTMPARRALALCGALLLAACDPGQATTSPEAVVGSWHTVQEQGSGSQGLHTDQWLDLLADGTYRWIRQVSEPARPPQDGVVERFEHSGNWKIVGNRLGLRTMTGMGWRRGQGGYQSDYTGEWSYEHRLRVDGDRLELHFFYPGQTIAPYTLVFERAADTGPFPMGHGR